MNWLNKLLNLNKKSKKFSHLPSLMRVEALTPSQRSSRIFQVKNDLLTLSKEDAIKWLENNISSPVSRDWGRLLVAVFADWHYLKSWMEISKLHALASADAINYYIYNHEKLPDGANPDEVIAALKQIASKYENLRLNEILENVSTFVNPIPLTKNLLEAKEIIFGNRDLKITLLERETFARWHSLLHKAHNIYCVSVLDWNSSEDDLKGAVSSLPIVINSKPEEFRDLVFETIDVGSDEIILIALPAKLMSILKKLVPSQIAFQPTKVRPTQLFKSDI